MSYKVKALPQFLQFLVKYVQNTVCVDSGLQNQHRSVSPWEGHIASIGNLWHTLIEDATVIKHYFLTSVAENILLPKRWQEISGNSLVKWAIKKILSANWHIWWTCSFFLYMYNTRETLFSLWQLVNYSFFNFLSNILVHRVSLALVCRTKKVHNQWISYCMWHLTMSLVNSSNTLCLII